ncbi:MAG: DMT family transporter [Flavobacteriaceae bacterium]|jgi:drug/metabolite transporter (DMT)-like permease|nr:DMT family transporter [Flavobacteriaceae bacterium]MDG1963031.1 DMT family transporter [Flavobacteriaceae bacterium]
MQNGDLIKHLHLHLIVFIWGFTAVLGALISLEAIPLVWFRMGIASLVVMMFVLITKKPLRFPKKTMFLLLGLGVALAVHWLTFFGAIKVSNVSVTLSVMSTGAFFASILDPILYRKTINWREVFLGVIAMIGLGLIFQASMNYLYGILLALLSAFLSALFSVVNGRLAQLYSAGSIAFYELLFGVLGISVYLGLTGGFVDGFFDLNSSDWLFLFVLATVCTAYAFIASVHLMKWLTPFTVMLTINLEPIYGILLALVVFGDSEFMSGGFYAGALIILATVIANGILKLRRGRKSKEFVGQ